MALLIRRLRMRLGIPADRLQVICTSASFKDPDYAVQFGAQLTGKDPADFGKVQGDLLLRSGAATGTLARRRRSGCNRSRAFYDAETDDDRLVQIAFLEYRDIARPWQLQHALYEALDSFGPMANLINLTMTEAQPVDALGERYSMGVAPDVAARAVTNLIALGSIARREPTEPGLLPCRVHSFYRGLPASGSVWTRMHKPICAQRGGRPEALQSTARHM